jgi:hypothetical protein
LSVSNAARCAQIPALLDAIEEELAEEESKLSWAAPAAAAATANGPAAAIATHAAPGTPPPQEHAAGDTGPSGSAALKDAFMSPEPGVRRAPPPTPARTPAARQLQTHWK